MKLKTSQQFYLKRLNKLILFLCLSGLSAKAFSVDEPYGIIESFEKLISIHKTQYSASEKLIVNNIQILSTVSNLKEFWLEENFVRSLLISSDDKYLSLVKDDECKFFSALENNLFKTASGSISSIPISFKDTTGITKKASVPFLDFFNELYKKKCFNNKEFSTLFSLTNVSKTINGIKFSIPKNQKECSVIHNEWLLNSYTPYLCQIHNNLINQNSSSREFYRKKISIFQRTYINNLCSHLNSAELFCKNYLKEDIWNKVINGEAPSYKMSYKCRNLFGDKEVFGKNEEAACAAKFTSTPETCEIKGNRNFPSVFPLQSCDLISQALRNSKLVTDYHDCPGNIDNEMLTNIHRIINHFDATKINSTPFSCSGDTNYSIAKLNFDVKNDEAWPLKICFLNRIENKEECVPYIPGSHPKEDRSEDLVIAKILYLHKGAPRKTTCKIVDSKTYNPIMSEFKLGCFIVYDSESCKNLLCNKKVIWDEKVLTDITFKGKAIYNYYSTTYLSERFSLVSLLNEVKGTQARSIKNLTDLLYFLDKNTGGIIHGVGCAEDLLPEYFYRTSINACHPLPFIIDGHVEKDDYSLLVFRSAIDDIHTPRLIMWHNIFSAVSAYQQLHPLNTWTLDGLKK